jgi:pimeloyl-ACP methyl ester carboxylesterase
MVTSPRSPPDSFAAQGLSLTAISVIGGPPSPQECRICSSVMATLSRDGLDLHYEVTGSGPALLLPKFNYARWDRYLDVGLLAGRFTVVTASPRGFGASDRLTEDRDYRVADLASDLVAVMEAARFGRFSVFGYSFTGAFAPWIAHLTDRVDAVVSGGFPIAGDYAPQYPEVQLQSEAARADPAAWAELTSLFDNRAALGFYRELSDLPPDFLVDSLTCPLFAFWGEDDEEIARFGGVGLLTSALDRRRLRHASFPGHDHNGMLAHINEALPSILAWFDELPPTE